MAEGQQQILVKHVTVNADQALVTDQVISDGSKQTTAGRLLTAGMDRPMGIIEPTQKEALKEGEGPSRNEQQPHAQGSCHSSLQSKIKADWATLWRACSRRLERLPHARRWRWCT